MKLKRLWILFAFATAAQGVSLDVATSYPPELKPEQRQAQAAHLAAELLTRYAQSLQRPSTETSNR